MRDAKSTKQKIHQAALALFVEKGLDATTTRELAQAAGIAEGTLYRHYVSKAALIEDLFLSNYAAFAGRLKALQAEARDFLSALRAVVDTVCGFYDQEPVMFRFLLLTQHQALPVVDSESDDNPVQLLQTMVAKAIQSGELPAQDAALSTALLLGLMLQPAVALVYGRLDGPLGQHADAIFAACRRVLNS